MSRILITGSREITRRETVADALTQAWKDLGREHAQVINGRARGADLLVAAIVRENRNYLTEEPYVVTAAEWRPQGPAGPVDRRAGHRRNQRMVDAGADLCLAFLKRGALNRGTRDCIARAKAAGIEVREFWEEP